MSVYSYTNFYVNAQLSQKRFVRENANLAEFDSSHNVVLNVDLTTIVNFFTSNRPHIRFVKHKITHAIFTVL